MNCPYCDFENIEGVDVCEQCGQPLSDLHLSDPQTAVERGLLKDRIGTLEPKPPICVGPTTSVGETLRLIAQNSIGCVFVVEGDLVVGVFSERDALLRLNTEATAFKDRPISDFMTPNPQSLSTDAKIGFAVHQMDIGGYRHLPIVDAKGKTTGVISVRDILSYLTERMTATS